MPPSKKSAKRINLTASGTFRRYLDFLSENTSLSDTSVIRFCVAEEANRRGFNIPLHQTSKIVRLGLLRKPIAFRKPIAIPLCNAKYGAFLTLEQRCNNLRLRNAYDRRAKLPLSPVLREPRSVSLEVAR
jgi:hypothetical protein